MLTRPLLLVAMGLAASSAQAQTFDDPPTDTFRDRSEAITILLHTRGFGASVVPGDDAMSFGTNCRLGTTASELSGGGVIREIGPNLSRHCDGPSNISGGSVLGGGLFSLGATRTVSQPVLDMGETVPAETVSSRSAPSVLRFNLVPADPVTSPGGSNLGSAAIAGPGWRSYGELRYFDVSESETLFSNGMSGDGWGGAVGVVWELSQGGSFGLELSTERLEGRSTQRGRIIAPLSTTLVADPDAPVDAATYQSFCGLPPGGSARTERTDATVFGTAELSGGLRLGYSAGVARVRQSYDNSVCIISDSIGSPLDNPITQAAELFAGRVAGRVAAKNVAGALTLFRDFPNGRAVLTPSFGLEVGRLSIDGYTETETPGSGTSLAVSGGARPTGTTLTYEPRDIDSLKARLGIGMQFPMDRRGRSLAFVNAVYVHEFGDGQQRIFARFSEDGRADPFRFSFLGAPVDRDYGELSAGLSIPVGRQGHFGLGAQALVGHEFSDSVTLSGSFSFSF